MSQKETNEDREKGEVSQDVLSVIVHQIRSPLATIRLIHDTLIDNDEGTLNKRQIELLKQAENRVNLIHELTEELLQAEGGSIFEREAELVEGSLEGLIDGVFYEAGVLISAKKLQVLRNYDRNTEPVKFDKSLMGHVVSNLVDNAIHYTPDGGTVTISTKYENGQVTISVGDTGPGIPENEKEHLFNRFTRLKTGIDSDHAGLGLGLYIAKKAIEKQGGTIWYEDNKPHGALFKMRLPD